jgi:dihydrofolate reductase
MRSVTYSMGVSLDGYIVGPDGDITAPSPDAEVWRLVMDEIRGVGVHLMGRRLYETMLYWESVDRDPPLDDAELEWAALWKPIPKVVFSTTLSTVQGNARLASGSLAEEIARLRAEPGDGAIAIGGATLAAEAAALDLIDEYRARVYPLLVGGGIPYFPQRARRVDLELVETRTFSSRVVYLHYRVVADAPDGSAAGAHQGASRRSVAADDPQRQAQQLVRARRHFAQVQALDDDHAAAEQRPMGRNGRVERRDRKVVDPDQADAAPDQRLGGRRVRGDESRIELGAIPQPCLTRPEQQSVLAVGDLEPGEVLRGDRRPGGRRVDDPGRPHQDVEARRLGTGGALDEVDRRIDVRAGVDAELHAADVAHGAVGHRLGELDVERWVAPEHRHVVVERDADVEPVHGVRVGDAATQRAQGRRARRAMPAAPSDP